MTSVLLADCSQPSKSALSRFPNVPTLLLSYCVLMIAGVSLDCLPNQSGNVHCQGGQNGSGYLQTSRQIAQFLKATVARSLAQTLRQSGSAWNPAGADGSVPRLPDS